MSWCRFNVTQNRKMIRRVVSLVLVVAFFSSGGTLQGAGESVDVGRVAYAIHSPYPHYPYEVRKWHKSGSGLYILRIDIQTGKVKRVTIAKSTGHKELDREAVFALEQWRFEPGKLPPISKLLPNIADSHRDTDSLAKVPVSFVLGHH